jgi:uncharacterized protein YacL
MNKKDYLLKLLASLKDIRPLANRFETIILEGNLDDELIEELLIVIRTAIHEVNDKITREKLQKGVAILEHIKQLETEKKAEDEKDLAKLDDMLAQM